MSNALTPSQRRALCTLVEIWPDHDVVRIGAGALGLHLPQPGRITHDLERLRQEVFTEIGTADGLASGLPLPSGSGTRCMGTRPVVGSRPMLPDHRKAEQRSLRYHAAIADRLVVDPSIVIRARRRVAGWLEDGSVAHYYADGWRARLAEPIDDLRAFLIEPSETARAFRQVSPFAGVLSAKERWALWAATESDDDATAA